MNRSQENLPAVAVQYAQDAGVGLSEATVRQISKIKQEPKWLLNFRLKALETFHQKELPSWVPKEASEIDFQQLRYYLAPGTTPHKSWETVPENIRRVFDKLGIPEQEQRFLAGVEAQFDSEMAYSNMRDELRQQGVLFVDSSTGLRDYESIFRPYFSQLIPVGDNKFSALNGAVFSGGSFIYVPKGVKLTRPLQAYFRINAERFGQFERTLIIADEGAQLTYLEGCTAPRFESTTLHAAVVELYALRGAKIHYITVQNWSNNVKNLVTKRARGDEDSEIAWIDCNIGSQLTMKYPAIVLAGKRARGQMTSISIASKGQEQDTGAKMIHLADETTSHIEAKSISFQNGITTYRGLVRAPETVHHCRNYSRCDGLLMTPESVSKTFPTFCCQGNAIQFEHEASISKISDDQLFYLQQRKIEPKTATALIVNGFLSDLLKQFPREYSVELRRLIELEAANEEGES